MEEWMATLLTNLTELLGLRRSMNREISQRAEEWADRDIHEVARPMT